MIAVESAGEREELERVEVTSDKKTHVVSFSGPRRRVVFTLKKSVLGGYSHGIIRVLEGEKEHVAHISRIELETIRHRLMEGSDHLLPVGGVIVRLKPEALGYIFPRESYRFFVRLLFRMWELGRKIGELRRRRAG